MILSVAPANNPPKQIKSNTGLRGVAALLVVAYHLQFAGYRLPIKVVTDLFDRGYLMVDLFFLLSGFILTYVNSFDGSISYSRYRSFLVGRFIRIYPLHIFCLLYLVIIVGFADMLCHYIGHATIFADWSSGSLKLLLAQITLTNGWFFAQNGWNTPTWSISVEIVAYAIFPFLLLVMDRSRAATGIVLLLSCAFYGAIALNSGNLDMIGRIAILRCLAGFSLGMVICKIRLSVGFLSHHILSSIQIVTLVLAVLVMTNNINDCVIIPLFCIIVYTTCDDRGLLGFLLGKNVLQYLGNISYSIYLNHVCLLIILHPLWVRIIPSINYIYSIDSRWFFPIFVGAVVGVSTMTYHYIERPVGRYLTKRWRARNLDQSLLALAKQ